MSSNPIKTLANQLNSLRSTGPLKTRESQSVGGLVLSALVMTSSGR